MSDNVPYNAAGYFYGYQPCPPGYYPGYPAGYAAPTVPYYYVPAPPYYPVYPYGQYTPGVVNAAVNRPKRSMWECLFCNLTFKNKTEHDDHIQESHVECEHEGCNYSAPLDIMEVHRLKHIKNENGESILDSVEETRRWIRNRKRRHPSRRKRDEDVSLKDTTDSTEASSVEYEESVLEKLLRDAHSLSKKQTKKEKKSALYPVISKVKEQPSALLRLSNPLKYDHLLSKLDSGPYSYRSAIGDGRCPHIRKDGQCKFGPKCAFLSKSQFTVPKRPPHILHLLKNDIYETEKTLIDVIKTIVACNFFDDE
ncbi:hypothetical protein BEWA_003630 [Theileria equi strain WA]|uniref:C2H2-type domain-containing protein n=1 Tax=Theileria equi strain WA TaxID=1537102 RepID=L0AZH2_THEEQ|nr:hypothetical protein BEWA_003630 [Theileria equi strain WA]AFZ80955.1 hypothetical protein BEWA_003630 [Theileria equi strain WA]|eukprot:XP_004830621.1 hypothetical protein BEWA_003630 [Theileria equi strain WA]